MIKYYNLKLFFKKSRSIYYASIFPVILQLKINQITWIILLNSSKEDLHSIQYFVANCWIALWTLLLGTLAVLFSSCNTIYLLLAQCQIIYGMNSKKNHSVLKY